MVDAQGIWHNNSASQVFVYKTADEVFDILEDVLDATEDKLTRYHNEKLLVIPYEASEHTRQRKFKLVNRIIAGLHEKRDNLNAIWQWLQNDTTEGYWVRTYTDAIPYICLKKYINTHKYTEKITEKGFCAVHEEILSEDFVDIRYLMNVPTYKPVDVYPYEPKEEVEARVAYKNEAYRISRCKDCGILFCVARSEDERMRAWNFQLRKRCADCVEKKKRNY